MSNIELWGPNVWFFLHGLAEKINQEKFSEIKSKIIEMIKIICLNLPCPECSKDASLQNTIYAQATLIFQKKLKKMMNVKH